jgi:hypothetical protein
MSAYCEKCKKFLKVNSEIDELKFKIQELHTLNKLLLEDQENSSLWLC